MAEVDVSGLVSALNRVGHSIETVRVHVLEVDEKVDIVGQQQVQTFERLEELAEKFEEFVAKDLLAKELQLAETRIVKVRQELEHKFGYYAEVRRMATGILQAVDVGLVGNDAVRNSTEELMMKAQGYWLAPVLVTVAAWVRDDHSMVDKALAESLRRDDYKTTIFFMLLMRRLRREQASIRWLERYFAHQNPRELDREFILILDAIATGAFTPAAQTMSLNKISEWMKDFSQEAGFLDAQKTRWTKAFQAWTPTVPSSEYDFLRSNSPTWPKLESSLASALRNQKAIDHFSGVFQGEVILSSKLAHDLDEMLNRLASRFDDEELPLRKQERHLQLIIDHGGEAKQAGASMAAEEQVFESSVHFMDLITNASLNPDATGALKATQRFAIATSRDWILDAHETLTAAIRADVPEAIEIKIGDWTGETKNGENEEELLSDLGLHLDAIEAEKLATANMQTGTKVGASIVAIIGLLLLVNGVVPFGLIMIAVAAMWFFVAQNKANQAKAQMKEQLDRHRETDTAILKAVVAEAVDYRQEWTREDAKAETFREMMLKLLPGEHTQHRADASRAVLN